MRLQARAALVLGLAGALGAWSQQGRAPGEGKTRRDEAYKMVDAYLVSNMQESLGLTDEQFVKLLPVVKKLQTERREQIQRRMQAMMALRRLLGSGRATEAQIEEALKEVKHLEQAGPAALQKNMEAIDAQLGTLQQAKFRILEVEVERKVHELLVRVQRPAAGGRRGLQREVPEQ